MDVKYSVIVPLYNTEKYIFECLNSLCACDRANLEIIVVNDGSTDHSVKIVEAWQKKDSRIYMYHQKNSGVATARNNGIEAANGEWIFFVDADDYVLPGMFQKIDDVVKQYPNCDYFCFAYDSVKKIENIQLSDNKEKLVLSTLKVTNYTNEFSTVPRLAGICGKIIKKSFIKKHRIHFIPGLVMGEDMLFNMEILMNLNQIVFIPGNFYYYRINNQSASRGSNNKIPKSDLKFQIELEAFANKYELNEVRNTGCIRSALGGILISCNSCFYRYPIKDYKKFKHNLMRFISNSVYANALKQTKEFSGFNLFQKAVLFGLKLNIYWPGYFFKKFYWKFSKGL